MRPVRWLLRGRVVCPRLDSAVELSEQRMSGYPSANPRAMERQRIHVLRCLRRDAVLHRAYSERELLLELELRRESRSPGGRVLPVRLVIPADEATSLEARITQAMAVAASGLLP